MADNEEKRFLDKGATDEEDSRFLDERGQDEEDQTFLDERKPKMKKISTTPAFSGMKEFLYSENIGRYNT